MYELVLFAKCQIVASLHSAKDQNGVSMHFVNYYMSIHTQFICAFSVVVIGRKSEVGMQSSNSGWDCYVQFCTNLFGEGVNPFLLPLAIRNSWADWAL